MKDIQYESMLNYISDAFFILDRHLVVKFFNQAAEKALGKKADIVLGKPLLDSFPEGKNSIFEKEYRIALKEKEFRSFKTKFETKPFNNWYEVRIHPIKSGIAVFFHIITQQKEEEEKLLFQAQLLNAVNNAVIATDTNNKVVYWNKMAEELYGWRESEALGRDIMELTIFEMSAQQAREIIENISKGEKWSGDFICRHKSGKKSPVFVTNSPIYDSENNFKGIIGVSNDISERKNNEEKVKASEYLIREKVEEYTAANEELLQANEELNELTKNLFEKNQRINALLNASPDIMFVFGKDNVFLDWHTSDFRNLVLPPELFLNKNASEVLPPDIASLNQNAINRVFETGETVFYSYSLAINGEEKNFDARMVKLGHNKALSIIRDVTEEKVALQQNSLLASIIEKSEDFIGVADHNQKVMFINEAGRKMVGIEKDQDLSKINIFDFFLPEDIPFINQTIMPSVLKDGRWSGEFRFRHFKTGKSVPIYYDLFRTDDPISGEAINFSTISRDLTAQKKAETLLKESEEKYKKIFEAINDGITIFKIENGKPGKFIEANSEAGAMLGYSRQELLVFTPTDIEKESSDIIINKRINELKSKGVSESETRIKHRNGNLIDVEVKAIAINYNGEPAILNITRNITERKVAEQALRESEITFRALFEKGPIGVAYHKMIYDENNKPINYFYIDANESYKKLTGVNPKGKLVTEVFPGIENDPFNWIETFGEVAKTGKEIRFQQHLETNNRWYDCAAYQYKPDHFVAAFLEVTEQKQIEAALTESEKRFRSLFENATVGIYRTSVDGQILMANPALVKMLRYESVGELQQRNLEMDGYNPDYPRSKFHERIAEDGEIRRMETSWQTKDGSLIDLLESSWLVHDQQNKPLYYEGIVEDVTLQKKTRDALIESQKQVEVAKESVRFKQNFLANMSHEIRTPLTGIIGMLDILDKTSLDKLQREYLNILKDSGENLKEIINQVLDFSKIEAGKVQLHPRIFKFEDLISNARKLFGGICSYKGIHFQYNPESKIPEYLFADNIRLSRIINNLISNAIKFTEEGSVTISAQILEHNPDTDLMKIKIIVSDTGIGIAKDKLPKLFTPFGQIDEKDTRSYEGSGLGLSICKELASLMNGETGVKSEVGTGSSFWFTFEASKAKPRKTGMEMSLQNNEKTDISLRILLAEDKAVNQKVISLILKGLGHKVTIACNGKTAVEIYGQEEFDLILMDIQMPVMDGITATHKLKELYKNLPPVVGLSANAFEGDKEKYMLLGMDDYITKPIKSKDFQELIKKLF